ncbi:MAG: hypothetical protein R3C61_27015 [Bacteroidia bacterium]
MNARRSRRLSQICGSAHRHRQKQCYAFDTPEEPDAMREELKDASSDVQQYNHISRVK